MCGDDDQTGILSTLMDPSRHHLDPRVCPQQHCQQYCRPDKQEYVMMLCWDDVDTKCHCSTLPLDTNTTLYNFLHVLHTHTHTQNKT